jgi:HJR/Mrr/RecB family endonuclease
MAKKRNVQIVLLLNRVLNKLSAVRKTMPASERAVLDMLVTGESAEVSGHMVSADIFAKSPAKTLGADIFSKQVLPAKTHGAKIAPPAKRDDVVGHAWGVDLTAKRDLSAKTHGAKITSAKRDDVVGHALRPGPKGSGFWIVFDAVTAKYVQST